MVWYLSRDYKKSLMDVHLCSPVLTTFVWPTLTTVMHGFLKGLVKMTRKLVSLNGYDNQN